MLILFRIAWWTSGQELTSWLSACDVLIYAVLSFCVPFPYDVCRRKWNSIVSVPEHCPFIYFDVLTFFIKDSADKQIASKTNRSVSSIPWIAPEIRRQIRRKNTTDAKANKSGSSKLRSKFETLRREIKADIKTTRFVCE